jgi:hypothetical protein
MSDMLIVLAAAIVFAQASTPPATPPVSQPAKAAAPAKPPKPKLVCHDETATGSIISNRVCRTVEQVEADRRQADRDNGALADHLAACHGQSC